VSDDRDPTPMFPLPGLVALPGTELGFHFFEPRYRAMARDFLARGSTSELVLAEVLEGEDPRRDDTRLESIASIARPLAAEVNRDGTIDVVLRVHARVRIEESPRGELLYRRARCTVLDDIVRASPALEATEASLRACARELSEIEREHGGEGGVRLDGGAGLLSDRLADRYLRRDATLRRKVLETLDVLDRGELVLEQIARILAAIREAQGGLAS